MMATLANVTNMFKKTLGLLSFIKRMAIFHLHEIKDLTYLKVNMLYLLMVTIGWNQTFVRQLFNWHQLIMLTVLLLTIMNANIIIDRASFRTNRSRTINAV